MIKLARLALGMCVVLGIAGLSSAQRGGGRGMTGGYGGDSVLTFGGGLMELPADRAGVPLWEVDSQFKKDVFTFVRLRYTSTYGSYAPGDTKGENWRTDFPNSDLNLPYRLQQMTSMKVEPNSKRIDITDPALFSYPFVYMLEIQRLRFSDEELQIMRRYLLNGGFLMVDDHWGLFAQKNFAEQMKRVFPERELEELPLEHPIFHCVFDLKAKPQIPGIENWVKFHRSWEQPDDTEPHYRTIKDDKGRMMLIECANTDLGDGWEREGENEEFFHLFSEKQAYPMGINIIFYAMTH